MQIATKKTTVFGVVGADHLRTKIIINDETLEQVSQFTYLGCSISYQFYNDVDFKLAKFLQSIGTIKRTIFKKVRTETILKIYNTLVLPTFLYGLENCTLTALQRRRIEAAEMKLLRPLAGYTLYDHKTNDYIRCELRITGILDKIGKLAFTLAKNATKLSPFEIIPLQTTRKENNWKTKEALARVAVTLETERIKGSNP